MIKRPSAIDDEDEILRQQEEFLRNRSSVPAVSVVKKRKDKRKVNVDVTRTEHHEDTDHKKPRSKFAASRKSTLSADLVSTPTDVNPFVLGDIVEKHYTGNLEFPPAASETYPAFPEPFERDKMLSGNGRSIFAEQFEQMKSNGFVDAASSHWVRRGTEHASVSRDKIIGDESYIVSGPLAKEIHEENVEKLNKLSNEEIERERETLMANMDPKLIEFLRSRRQVSNKNKTSETVNSEVKQVDMNPGNSSEFNLAEYSEMDVDGACQPLPEDADDMFPDMPEEVADDDFPYMLPGGIDDSVPEMLAEVANDNYEYMLAEASNRMITDMIEEEEFTSDVAMPPEVTDDAAALEDVAENVDSDLPPEVAEINKWLNMGIVEKEKLEWMKDLPDSKPVPPDEYHARFDFEGFLLPFNEENINVTKALHHHGEEPERPGYTLQELYQLSRSSVLQQRVLAINTIAHIIFNVRAGCYDRCFEEPLLRQMLDADLFLLLRFSLDDNTETQVAATLLALRNLLFTEADEVCLDRLLDFPNGQYQPSMDVTLPPAKPSELEEHKENEKEMKDHQLLKLDLIKGALRTDLILRIRYILEVIKPTPVAVANIFEILMRIARHSSDSAYAITCCPRLMQFITAQFLPKNWIGISGGKNHKTLKSVYGVPVVGALRLMRIIACQSRNLASDIIRIPGLTASLEAYITIDFKEFHLPRSEASALCLETFHIMRVFMSYDLGIGWFNDLYPVFTRFLHFHIQVTSISNIVSYFDLEHGAALIALIEQVTRVEIDRGAAMREAELTSKTRTFSFFSGAKIPDYFTLIENCAVKWLSELSRAPALPFQVRSLVGVTLNYLATFYAHLSELNFLEVSTQEQIESFLGLLTSFMDSSNYQDNLMPRLRQCSYLLMDYKSGNDRDPPCLPSLGSVNWGGEGLVTLLKPPSPFPLLIGLVHFFRSCLSTLQQLQSKTAKGVEECVRNFLSNAHLQSYISQLYTARKNLPSSNWYARYEVAFLVSLAEVSVRCGYSGSYFVLLRLVPLVQTHDKPLLKDILQDIFSLSKEHAVMKKLESLTVNRNDSEEAQALLTEVLNDMQDIKQCYLSVFGLDNIKMPSAMTVKTLTCSAKDREPCLPNDWAFFPITFLYKEELSGQPASEEMIKAVKHCLQWVYTLEYLAPKIGNSPSATTKFCRLATVFLVASDLFLDAEIAKYLDIIFKNLIAKSPELNFNKKIPGLLSFYDLYVQLLEQYAAVSYGNKLFGQFILVPLQQRNSVELRKLIWTEYPSILRLLPAKFDEPYVPYETFLYPKETDPTLLTSYLLYLEKGVIREKQSPVLFHIAASHVADFIVHHPETVLAKQLQAHVDSLKNEDVKEFLMQLLQKLKI